jgi:hypothetical protein
MTLRQFNVLFFCHQKMQAFLLYIRIYESKFPIKFCFRLLSPLVFRLFQRTYSDIPVYTNRYYSTLESYMASLEQI